LPTHIALRSRGSLKLLDGDNFTCALGGRSVVRRKRNLGSVQNADVLTQRDRLPTKRHWTLSTVPGPVDPAMDVEERDPRQGSTSI
jgi:hypothetical protein